MSSGELARLRARLIEVAADLPGVRAGVDHAGQQERALEIAKGWYTWVVGDDAPRTRPEKQKPEGQKRGTLSLKGKGPRDKS